MAFYLYTVGKKYLAKAHCVITKNKETMCKKGKGILIVHCKQVYILNL